MTDIDMTVPTPMSRQISGKSLPELADIVNDPNLFRGLGATYTVTLEEGTGWLSVHVEVDVNSDSAGGALGITTAASRVRVLLNSLGFDKISKSDTERSGHHTGNSISPKEGIHWSYITTKDGIHWSHITNTPDECSDDQALPLKLSQTLTDEMRYLFDALPTSASNANWKEFNAGIEKGQTLIYELEGVIKRLKSERNRLRHELQNIHREQHGLRKPTGTIEPLSKLEHKELPMMKRKEFADLMKIMQKQAESAIAIVTKELNDTCKRAAWRDKTDMQSWVLDDARNTLANFANACLVYATDANRPPVEK